jgi:hypothetical protein
VTGGENGGFWVGFEDLLNGRGQLRSDGQIVGVETGMDLAFKAEEVGDFLEVQVFNPVRDVAGASE